MSDNLNDAAAIVQAAETTALTALGDALNSLDTAVKAIVGNLDYPAGFASNALRIANNLSMSITWPKSEIANLLSPNSTVTAAPAGPAA